MAELLTISEKLKTALLRYCASWECETVRTDNELSTDVRLTGFLVAIPVMAMVNIATDPVAFFSTVTAPALGIVSLAISLVMIALLAKINTSAMRGVITIALGPYALAAMTQGRLSVALTTVMILAVLAIEARRGLLEQTKLATSSILTLTLASICLGITGGAALQFSALLALVPMAVAALAYGLSIKTQKVELTESKLSVFDIASAMTKDTGIVCALSDRTAHISAVSSNLYDVLQLSAAEFADQAFLDRVHLADKVALLALLDAVSNGQPGQSITLRLQSGPLNSDKARPWKNLTCAAMMLDGQLIIKLEAIEGQAQQQDEQPRKSELSALAIVSHELRTPLNAIIGFSDLMGKGLAGELANERQREYLGHINKSGTHLLALVNTILDLSKLGNGTYELETQPFLPEEAAEFALSMLATQASDKHLGLNYFPYCALEEFSGDKRICQQIMINLLSNAVKFTPDHGTVAMKLQMDEGKLIIEVEDTGKGMSKDELGKVGTPFFQASASHGRLHEGAGLGLSLVRQMAQLHGGAMEIQSEIGRGTKVRVVLAAKGTNVKLVSDFRHLQADESVRIIQLNEDGDHGPLRKTA